MNQLTMKKMTKALTVIFFIVVVYILFKTLSHVDWSGVQIGLAKLSWKIIFPVMGLVALVYFILSTYDYIGFRYFDEPSMSYPRVAISAFSCYAASLNLGAMVGGIGFRFRIYSGWGISKKVIPKIVTLSTITNWLGYALLLSTVFCFKSEEIQDLLGLPHWASLCIGIFQYGVILAYMVLCVRRFVMTFKGVTFAFPKLPLALLQLSLSTLQWSLISFIIYFLIRSLGHQVDFGQIVFTSLIASVAGVLTHIPGGLGVLETIFLKVNLGVPAPDLLAALICFRVLFYLVPLLVAIPAYLSLEYYQKKLKRS